MLQRQLRYLNEQNNLLSDQIALLKTQNDQLSMLVEMGKVEMAVLEERWNKEHGISVSQSQDKQGGKRDTQTKLDEKPQDKAGQGYDNDREMF